MAGWVDRWKDGWVDGYTNGWMDGWMCGWMAGWMDGMRQEGDFFFNGHFLTTLKTKFKNKTADFPGGPVVKNPSAHTGTQLPSLFLENATRLGPTGPMSHNSPSPRTKRLCAYTREAPTVRSPWTPTQQQPAHSKRDLAEPR